MNTVNLQVNYVAGLCNTQSSRAYNPGPADLSATCVCLYSIPLMVNAYTYFYLLTIINE